MNRRIKTLGTLLTTAAIATATFTSPAHAGNDPTQAEIESAQLSADLTVSALVAALVQIIGDTTPDNVEEGNRAVTMLFGDGNDSVRLIGDFDPLEPDSAEPAGDFEEQALALALMGEGLEQVDKKELLRSVPLQYSTTQCAVCHDGWEDQGIQLGDYVGALIISVPIDK